MQGTTVLKPAMQREALVCFYWNRVCNRVPCDVTAATIHNY